MTENAQDNFLTTACIWHREEGHINIARLLLEHECRFGDANISPRYSIALASEGGIINNRLDVAPTTVDVHIQEQQQLYSIAIWHQREAHIKSLGCCLRTRVRCERQDGAALHNASGIEDEENQRRSIVLEHGVDVNTPDNYLTTALHLASKQGTSTSLDCCSNAAST